MTAPARGFGRAYWLYMTAGAFFAAGLMSFELVSYHVARVGFVARRGFPRCSRSRRSRASRRASRSAACTIASASSWSWRR
jgi:hypothetical protein